MSDIRIINGDARERLAWIKAEKQPTLIEQGDNNDIQTA